MALVSLNVKREQPQFGRGKNYATEEWAVDDSQILKAVPSVSKKGNITDGEVQSKVTYMDGDRRSYLYVTDTVTTILALS